MEHLPWVLLGLHAAPKDEAGVSAAEATYGHSLVLSGQLQPPPRAPQVAPEKVDITSTISLAKEKEKEREVGIQALPMSSCGRERSSDRWMPHHTAVHTPRW